MSASVASLLAVPSALVSTLLGSPAADAAAEALGAAPAAEAPGGAGAPGAAGRGLSSMLAAAACGGGSSGCGRRGGAAYHGAGGGGRAAYALARGSGGGGGGGGGGTHAAVHTGVHAGRRASSGGGGGGGVLRGGVTSASGAWKPRGLKRANTLKLLPSRLVSRVYGAFNSIPLPVAARPVVYGAWSWWFRVKLDEVPRPLADYPTMTSFFTRRLRAGVRPIHATAPLVSPVDGAVVSVSADMHRVGKLAQVKGIEYHLSDFLGIDVPPIRPGNALYSAVLYLSPGDYHRFHSPTEWTVTARKHIAGQLLPVNPIVARMLPSLFCTNERVALFGEWAHGFFSYTAVGATNVGSIRIDFDPEVCTNTYAHDWHCGFNVADALSWVAPVRRTVSYSGGGAGGGGGVGGSLAAIAAAAAAAEAATTPGADATHVATTAVTPFTRKGITKVYDAPIKLARGDDVGLFELGSTVVLVFEAPADFVFDLEPDQKVTMGMPIANCPSAAAVTAATAAAAAAAAAAECGDGSTVADSATTGGDASDGAGGMSAIAAAVRAASTGAGAGGDGDGDPTVTSATPAGVRRLDARLGGNRFDLTAAGGAGAGGAGSGGGIHASLAAEAYFAMGLVTPPPRTTPARRPRSRSAFAVLDGVTAWDMHNLSMGWGGEPDDDVGLAIDDVASPPPPAAAAVAAAAAAAAGAVVDVADDDFASCISGTS